jgi:hypothetical protein
LTWKLSITFVLAIGLVAVASLSNLRELWVEVFIDRDELYESILVVEEEIGPGLLSFSEVFELDYVGSYKIALYMKSDDVVAKKNGGVVRVDVSIESENGRILLEQSVLREFDPRTYSMSVLAFNSDLVGIGEPLTLKFEISQESGNVFNERTHYGVVVRRHSNYKD